MNKPCASKPFVKWAGGKTQLLSEIAHRLPRQFRQSEAITYVEPFVGGGAVFFHLKSHYKNITHAVINDINPRLITAYRAIQQSPDALISELSRLQKLYLPLSQEARTEMYMNERERFNSGNTDSVETAALFIFLNRTCFNGLYRENSRGGFNVPHGKYVRPLICDEQTIRADSLMLQGVTITCGDFSSTECYAGPDTFFYFDPPYKPLSGTSSFNTYVKEPFDDNEQQRLRDFTRTVCAKGSQFVLSNSDVRGTDPSNNFFDDLYSEYTISRVFASRMVNANPQKRGKLTELMISNVQADLVSQQSLFL